MFFNIMIVIIILLIIILWLFKYLNGYLLLNTINQIYTTYDIKNKEYYKTDMKWCKKLRDNYLEIKNEYISYIKKYKLKRFRDVDKMQQYYDISDIPWDVLFLKVYNKDTNKIKYFPKTYELINNIPGCSLAMFSVLYPGKVIPPHYGPYKGVLRYHLTLIAPKKYKKCQILVNNKPYNWKEGKDVLFDDTYIHSVKNESDETRIVLFLDIKKNFNNIFLNSINNIILYFCQFNDTVHSIVENTNNK